MSDEAPEPETIRCPKGLFADNDVQDESNAWAAMTRRHKINADMRAGTAHTDSEWAWLIVRPEE